MTSATVLLPYLLFCLVMTGTPGPNNAMALASGVRVGLFRSLPLVLGVAIGVATQLTAIGFGLGAVLASVPYLYDGLRVLGTACLLWIAYKIAVSGPISADTDERRPVGFMGAAFFQWVNPKAWAVTTSAVAIYLPEGRSPGDVVIAALCLAIIGSLCVGAWAAGGTALRRVLQNPRRARWFNGVMAGLLALSTLPILFGP